jgi:hypothetical protein
VPAGLNFPAVAVAALSLVPFEDYLRTGASRDLTTHVLTAMYIPVLFLIGKQLDGRGRMKAASFQKEVTPSLLLLSQRAWVGVLCISITLGGAQND